MRDITVNPVLRATLLLIYRLIYKQVEQKPQWGKRQTFIMQQWSKGQTCQTQVTLS